MYDSREGTDRSAEFRLYDDSALLQLTATAGDILIVLRPTDDVNLRALVLSQQSTTGRLVAETLQRSAWHSKISFARLLR